MNLVRLGHYYTPNASGDGTCQTALVVGVVEQDPMRAVVNLKVWQHDGDEMTRLNVQQNDPMAVQDHATFHLSGECPFGK